LYETGSEEAQQKKNLTGGKKKKSERRHSRADEKRYQLHQRITRYVELSPSFCNSTVTKVIVPFKKKCLKSEALSDDKNLKIFIHPCFNQKKIGRNVDE